MEIQIPRSYNGPITIHVASGNLDEHIVFSRDVKERKEHEAVLIEEEQEIAETKFVLTLAQNRN